MNSVVRVLIGDDHRIAREGLKQVLGDPANGAPEIAVVAEATQGIEVLEQVTALRGATGACRAACVLTAAVVAAVDPAEAVAVAVVVGGGGGRTGIPPRPSEAVASSERTMRTTTRPRRTINRPGDQCDDAAMGRQ